MFNLFFSWSLLSGTFQMSRVFFNNSPHNENLILPQLSSIDSQLFVKLTVFKRVYSLCLNILYFCNSSSTLHNGLKW